MRLGALALAAVALSSLSAAEIPQGTHVLLNLMNTVTTRTAQEGDYVYMRTAMPLVANGQVVAPEGSYVQGVITRVTRPGRVSGKAELGIRIETMTLASGKVIKLSPRLSSVDSEGSDQKASGENGVSQGGSHGADAASVARMGGTGAAIGAIVDRSWTGAGIGAGAGGAVGLAGVLLSRGKEVELRKGSTIDVVFEHAVKID